MESTVKEKIERWRILADIFVNKDKKVFIKEINGDLHFCKIVLTSHDSLIIYNFGPGQREGLEEEIYWVQISDFDEYREMRE